MNRRTFVKQAFVAGSLMNADKAESGTGPFVKIAGLQMKVGSDIADNRERILEGIRRARLDRVDFLITPEGSLSGYRSDFDASEVTAAIETVTRAARQAKVGLALGTCFKENGSCFNQVRVYAPEGEHLGVHSKILRCSPLNDPEGGEVSQYQSTPLRVFRWKGICFGSLICNDLWATPGYTAIPNPFLAWQLKKLGAQAIFHSVNSGTNQRYRGFHQESAELWARSLSIPIVEVNAAAGSDKAVNAQSGVVDATGTRTWRVPPEGEQYFSTTLTLAASQ